MSVIRPFRGLRPRPEFAPKVAAPPYDVLSSDEARELVKNNPISFLRVNKPEVDFPSDHNPTGKDVYETGRKNLQKLIDDGIMCRDAEECFYLYRLTWQGRSQTGLMALTSVDEYNNGLIKKHEHTRPAKVSDRADHIQGVNAQVGPVFSIFRHNDEIKAIFTGIRENTPLIDFTTPDEVRHEMWVVADPKTVNALVEAFGKLPALYIADGHHRSAAAAEVARRRKEANPNHTGNERYNFFMNVLFPDEQLRILAYNRVVQGLNGLTADSLFEKAADKFTTTPSDKSVEPSKHYDFGVFVAGKWYTLTCKPGLVDEKDPVNSIDAAVLTEHFLTPYLGIGDVRTDERIDFVGGIRGVAELERLVNEHRFDISFSLYPVSVAQLLAVADANAVMPPKSTWFEPKLRSGMVVNLFDE